MWRIVAGHPKTFYTREEFVKFATRHCLGGPIAWHYKRSLVSHCITCAQYYHGMADSTHRSASLVSALSAGHLATIVPLTGQGQFMSGPGRWGDW